MPASESLLWEKGSAILIPGSMQWRAWSSEQPCCLYCNSKSLLKLMLVTVCVQWHSPPSPVFLSLRYHLLQLWQLLIFHRTFLYSFLSSDVEVSLLVSVLGSDKMQLSGALSSFQIQIQVSSLWTQWGATGSSFLLVTVLDLIVQANIRFWLH